MRHATSFRQATIDDEQLFFQWRQIDEHTGLHYGYWQGTPTDKATHHHWYQQQLQHSQLLVWIKHGIAIGIVRIEPNNETSFSTDSEHQLTLLDELRDLGLGKLKFTVDQDDPKTDALEQAGYQEWPVRFFTT